VPHAGVSIAAVALEHRLNANLLRRWVVTEERAREAGLIAAATGSITATGAFVPVELASPAVGTAQEIVIELQRGATLVKVNWPLRRRRPAVRTVVRAVSQAGSNQDDEAGFRETLASIQP
jgi:transposase-like protein